MNAKILIAFLAMFAVGTSIVQSAITGSPAVSLFNQVRPSLLIIKTGTGTGSGFVAEIDGKKRLITNEHVLRGGRPFEAKSLDGQRLRLGSTIYLGNESDLCMIEIIGTDIPGLILATNQPALEDDVYVFGNSDGGGVATTTEGKILGVGPDRIEVSAPFVQGNSGSPIMLGDGTVIGVATYVTRSEDPRDWVKRGTRFTDTRRYGLRLTNIQWITLNPKEYFDLSNAIVDLETYFFDLYDLIFADKERGYPYYSYNYAVKKLKYREYVRLCELLATYANALSESELRRERAMAFAKKWVTMNQRQKDAYTMDGVGILDAHKASLVKKEKAQSDLSKGPRIWISSINWRTKSLYNEARFMGSVIDLLMQHGHATPQTEVPD
ncbi:MAG: serine protease [Clostridia bacterium]|nr:serine protease [Clostridia bacterium]